MLCVHSFRLKQTSAWYEQQFLSVLLAEEQAKGRICLNLRILKPGVLFSSKATVREQEPQPLPQPVPVQPT